MIRPSARPSSFGPGNNRLTWGAVTAPLRVACGSCLSITVSSVRSAAERSGGLRAAAVGAKYVASSATSRVHLSQVGALESLVVDGTCVGTPATAAAFGRWGRACDIIYIDLPDGQIGVYYGAIKHTHAHLLICHVSYNIKYTKIYKI